MKAKILLNALFLLTISAFLFSGCAKEVANILQKESTADRNSIFAEQTFDREEVLADAEVLTPGGVKSTEAVSGFGSQCLIKTFDLVSNPKKLTLDFGTSNCLCADGKNRRGKMHMTFNGSIMDSLTVISMTFDNYFVNEDQVIGTRSITTKGRNAAGHLNQDISTNGSIVLANNGGTIIYLSDQNRERTAGEKTLSTSDDVYSITGSASGTTTAGQAFTISIATPLVWMMSCTNFVSGVLELKPAGDPKRSIDFGNGDCDNSATVKVLGISFQIIL